MLEDGLRKQILRFIRSAGRRGATITEIERNVSLERHTLAKYLYLLKRDGILDYKPVGRAKLWYINEEPLTKLLSKENKSFLERVLTDVIDMNPSLIFITDQKFNITYANQEAKAKYGSAPGRKIGSILSPGEVEKLKKAIGEGQKEIRLKDIEGNLMKVNGAHVMYPDGRSAFIIMMHEVLIDRYYDLFQNAPKGYKVLDRDERIIDANSVILDIMGYDINEVIGQKMSDFLAPGEVEKFNHYLKNLHLKGTQEAVMRLQTKEGESIPVHVDSSIHANEGGVTYIRSIVDRISSEDSLDMLDADSEKQTVSA